MRHLNHVADPAAHRADDRLEADTIGLLLPDAVRHAFDLRVVDATASTNSDLLAGAGTLPSGSVLVAEHQTAGRGRRGRAWVAPPGGSLAFSLLWKFDLPPAALAGLSLAVGLGIARAADACGATGLKLKWPNDLIAWRAQAGTGGGGPASRHAAGLDTSGTETGGAWAKAGGILVELATPAPGHPGCHAVIGIGLNVALGDAIRSIDQAATDFTSLGMRASRNRLLAACLAQLLPILREFGNSGFAPHVEDWNRRHAWQDQPLVLSGEASASLSGIARGVDVDGALLFDTEAGLRRIISGELSLRRAAA